MAIPEIEAAASLARVAELGQRRQDLIAETERITTELREECVNAARAGAVRTRIRDLAGISPATIYDWLTAAGIEMRVKRSKTD